MGLFGRKKQVVVEVAPPITLSARGGATSQEDQAHLLTAKQSPGFLFAQRMLAHALDSRAETIMLDYTAQGVAVRYQIDGFWHASPGLDRASGDVMLAVMKVIANLNMNERRAQQKGNFGAEYKRKKYTCKLTSQGTQTGERVLVQFDDGKVHVEKLEDTGMRSKMVEELKAILAEHGKFVLISSPPASGFSTTFSAAMRSSDRYIRNWAELAEVSKQDKAVENVPITTYDASAGETPMTVLPKLLRTYPDVVAMRDMADAQTAELLFDQVTEEDRLIIAGIRAKDAAEALLRVLMLKVSPAKFASVISAVVCQRLVRKLCEDCKQPYAPQPQVLQQLGIPPGRIQALYRPQEGPMPLPPDAPKDAVPMVCPKCQGIGYRGRTGVFEMLVINDRLRQVLEKTPKIDIVRAEARKAGMRTMQEEGILLVAQGTTSLPELMRVLKE
jgi:type II secretory ATPase GspE/PulE/Tfp pilus assembly ATPase PilB-like protein